MPINPININPGNFGATAAFAGNTIGNLGIPVPDYSGILAAGKGIASGIQSSKDRALQEKQMAINAARESRLADMAQQQLGLQQREQTIKEGMFGLHQKEQLMKEKEFQTKIDLMAKAEAKEKSMEQLQAQGTAAYMISQLPKKEWEENKQGIINGLMDSKIINDDQGKTLATKSYRDVLIQAKAFTLISKSALELKKLEAGKQSDSGMKKIYDPETGKLVYESSPLTTPNQTKQQEKVIESDKILSNINSIKETIKPEYFTWRNRAGKEAIQMKEKAEGIPIVKDVIGGVSSFLSGKSDKEQSTFTKDFQENQTKLDQMFNEYRKYVTGAAASEKELIMLKESFINGDMSWSQLQGSLNALIEKADREKGDAGKTISSGVKIAPTNIDDNYINEVAKHAGKSPEQVRQDMKAKGWIK